MVSKAPLLCLLNILFFTLVSSTYVPCPPPPPKNSHPHKSPPLPAPIKPPTHKTPTTPTLPPTHVSPPTPILPPTPVAPPTPILPPTPKTPITPPAPILPRTPITPITPPTPILPPTPIAPITPPNQQSCPIDTLKLGACANLLGLVNVLLGSPANTPCCTLIGGLADLDAAVCLCTAIKANVLGINLNIPVSLSVLLNFCGKNVPSGFQCA